MHAFVRPGDAVREYVDLNVLVNDVLVLVAGDARRHGVSLRLQSDASLPVTAVDPIQIEQVILNLVRNAIDAVKGRGSQNNEVVVTTALESDGVVLRVCDDGPGVTARDRQRMFEAFYTTKPGGLGMGLSISRTIVQAHGGRLWAANNEGPGATVGFVLPLPLHEQAEVASQAS
jgi:signal transduction histidine kinase